MSVFRGPFSRQKRKKGKEKKGGREEEEGEERGEEERGRRSFAARPGGGGGGGLAQPQISGLFITQAQNGADRRVPEYFVVVCSDGVGGRCLGRKLPNRRPIFENIRVSPEKSR